MSDRKKTSQPSTPSADGGRGEGWQPQHDPERKHRADRPESSGTAPANSATQKVSLTRPSLPLEGEVRGVQGVQTSLIFRLQRYDNDGNTQQVVQVAIRNPKPAPGISEGDRVKIVSGKWKRGGTFRARRIQNVTTGLAVKAGFVFFRYSLLIFVVAVMAAIPLSILATPLAGLAVMVGSFVVFVISNIIAGFIEMARS